MRFNRDLLFGGLVVVLIAIVGFIRPSFVWPQNLAGLFNDTSVLIMLAMAQMTVILTKCIDLSVAANIALTGVLASLVTSASPDGPIGFAVLLAAVIGLALGAFNGLMVWLVGIPSIVVTLGTLSIYRGLAFVASRGTSIVGHQMSSAYVALPRAEFLGLPMMSWFAIVLIAVFAISIRGTRTGRALYAAGGNPTAAVYTGIDVGRTQFIAFCVSGTVAGFCGYLWATRFMIANVDMASGVELDVIASCVIGGVSISGGIGTVAGAVLGAIFF